MILKTISYNVGTYLGEAGDLDLRDITTPSYYSG